METTGATTSLLIRHAAQIVTGRGTALRAGALGEITLYEDASLYVEDGTIAAIGQADRVEQAVRGTPRVVEAKGRTVVPGFVDPHTHAVFAGSRIEEFVRRIQGATYEEIAARGGGIVTTMKATRAASKQELKDLTRARLRTALEYGTTTMEVKTGYGLDPEHEMKMLEVIAEMGSEQPIDLVPTFLGAHAVPPGISRGEYVDQLVRMLPSVAPRVKFCDVFCDANYFPPQEARTLLAAARKLGMSLQMHAGQFARDGGVRLGIDLGARALSHLDRISNSELEALGASPTAAILLPGVSLFGGTAFPAARKFVQAGAVLALATNFNPGSCPSISMPMMIALACLQMRLTPAEALNAATVNAAYALGLETLGSLEPGRVADLVILDLPDYRMLPYQFGINPVETVVKKGRVVWDRA